MRFTLGDARRDTIAQLERSIRGVRAAFGKSAALAVCVHSVDLSAVRDGVYPAARDAATWLQIDHDLPVFVRRRVGLSVADGYAWRFAPLRLFDDCSELMLATGFVVGAFASRLLSWAVAPGQRRCFVVRDRAGGIALRGVPVSYDLESALETVLARGPDVLVTSDDAVAAELAAVSCGGTPMTLRTQPRLHAVTAG